MATAAASPTGAGSSEPAAAVVSHRSAGELAELVEDVADVADGASESPLIGAKARAKLRGVAARARRLGQSLRRDLDGRG